MPNRPSPQGAREPRPPSFFLRHRVMADGDDDKHCALPLDVSRQKGDSAPFEPEDSTLADRTSEPSAAPAR